MYLNEFSYVNAKPDAKYFKNVMMICGQNNALHCFLPDPGTRQEILFKISNVLNDLQAKAVTRRQTKVDNTGKINFVIDINKKL